MKPRRHRWARAQREASDRTDARSTDQCQPVALDHGGDDELHLEGGEGAADAAPRAPAEDSAALLLELFPRIGAFREHIPGPGEGARGGRMPGDEDALQLVAEVGVGDWLTSGR